VIQARLNQPQLIEQSLWIPGRCFLIDVPGRQIEKALLDLPNRFQRQPEALQKPLDEEGSHSGNFL
jgi:hypothetical protein